MRNLLLLLASLASFTINAQSDSIAVTWTDHQMVSKSTASLQVVVNSLLRKGSSIHDQSFAALKNLGCEYVRFVPWLPYPKLGVAALEPPTKEKTSWDFTLIDPITIDFLEATKGHKTVMNFSTMPAWMWKTDYRVEYPENPDSVVWNYTQGLRPVDTTYNQIAEYYARLFSWYTKGGFTDELGKYHKSGYHYEFPVWEVLNEVDLEHRLTPIEYTKLYDAVVGKLMKLSPKTKFVGLSLTNMACDPKWFEYFLNPKNHKPGIPLDMISYHFYALGYRTIPLDALQYSFFDQADGFINMVKFIDNIRKRRSPNTKTTINEVGSILDDDFDAAPGPIPNEYWNLTGAMYAYLYVNLAKLGIDVINESQLVGYPTQFPSVSMMNWENGKPNSRYWILKILKENFGPGDVLVKTTLRGKSRIFVQGFDTKNGKRILVINKSNKKSTVKIPGGNAMATIVDPTTGDNEPVQQTINDQAIELNPFAVAIVSL